MHTLRACLAILLIAQPLAAQSLTAPPDAKARIDQHFERFNGRPGCSVGAAIDGATVFAGGYGVADLEHNIPITADTVFEPGSVSKQFTAAAVLLLEQQGKLSLDDPVRKYIPEVPDYGSPITIRHLIHHTSGLRDWGSVAAIAGWPRGTVARNHDDVLEIVHHQQALNYTPGAEYSYTNTGYNLLAILVDRVAGQSFAEFTREAIFAPLGMSSSSWRDDFRRIVPNRAIAYSPSGPSFTLNMPFENVHGNGGMLTTVGDLLRWNTNFTDARVGGKALVDSQLRKARAERRAYERLRRGAGHRLVARRARNQPQRRDRRLRRLARPLSGSAACRWRFSAMRAMPTRRSSDVMSRRCIWETALAQPSAAPRPCRGQRTAGTRRAVSQPAHPHDGDSHRRERTPEARPRGVHADLAGYVRQRERSPCRRRRAPPSQ